MTRKSGRISTARCANSSPSRPSGPSGILMSVNSNVIGGPSSKRASASLAFAAEKVSYPSSAMIDSANARTVGSSSATSTAGGRDFLVCLFATDTFLGLDQRRTEVRFSSEGRSRQTSQHAATEKDMIQGQKDDRAACGNPGALNGTDVETSRPAAAQKGEEPTADDRTDHAK